MSKLVNNILRQLISFIVNYPEFFFICIVFFITVLLLFIFLIIKWNEKYKQRKNTKTISNNNLGKPINLISKIELDIKKVYTDKLDNEILKIKSDLREEYDVEIIQLKLEFEKEYKIKLANDVLNIESKLQRQLKEKLDIEIDILKIEFEKGYKIKLANDLLNIESKLQHQFKEKLDIEIEQSKNNNKIKDEKNLDFLEEANSETSESNEALVYVDYNLMIDEKINNYPILRIPKKGTIVRSYRIGNSKRRGFLEESFQKSIEDLFGTDFSIIGDLRLNTGKDTRPFEPDIAILNNSNLRIDIEIDEPYAGVTRQPTHCIGEDINRDTYFVDRGWLVIRFSEYQVHSQLNDCLKFIAVTIKLALPEYIIPSKLENQSVLENENLWDKIQAQKWEKSNYREKYLQHTFKPTKEKKETLIRDLNDKEKQEEQLVKPSLIGTEDKTIPLSYNLLNINPRDSRIKFYPIPHIYTIDNIPAPSASTTISKFFPEFDAFGKARNLSRSNKLFGLPVNRIVEIWNERGNESAKLGTNLHQQIEKYFLNQDFERSEEFELFNQFYVEHSTLKPYRTEWRIFDEEFHIAGTIDLITKIGNSFELYDWKRSEKIIDKINKNPIVINSFGDFGVGKLSNIHDTSYNKYCLQQSLYKYILEKNYSLSISKMFLVVLHPEYNKFHKVEVPYLKNEIEFILKTL